MQAPLPPAARGSEDRRGLLLEELFQSQAAGPPQTCPSSRYQFRAGGRRWSAETWWLFQQPPRVRPISDAPQVAATLQGLTDLPLALQTAGDAGDGLLIFGMDMASLQQWTLIYLGLSSLAFVLVWVIGFLRR